jgi:mannosyltransferase OCH1-like enzyme
MVILKYGGVYADIDVECRKPLDTVLLPSDAMVVGWEVEVPTDEVWNRSGGSV